MVTVHEVAYGARQGGGGEKSRYGKRKRDENGVQPDAHRTLFL